MWFLLLSIAGTAIGLSGVPEIIPLAAFLISFAYGSMYVWESCEARLQASHVTSFDSYVQSTVLIETRILDRVRVWLSSTVTWSSLNRPDIRIHSRALVWPSVHSGVAVDVALRGRSRQPCRITASTTATIARTTMGSAMYQCAWLTWRPRLLTSE